MDGSKVASAVRIGSALATTATVEWDELFDAITAAIPATCAAQVAGWDPVTRRYTVLGERGYPPAISTDLAQQLPHGRWGEQLFAARRPLLMDDNAPEVFRHSQHYEQVLRPAGMQDGLSVGLRAPDGRRVGLLHLNAPTQSSFGEDERHFVTQISPALARRTDPLRLPTFDTCFGPHWSASRLIPRSKPLPVTGRAHTPLLNDPQIMALGEAFARLHAGSVTFVWPRPETWYQAMLLRVATPHQTGVVVASTPFANPSQLTARELDVATGIVAGLSNQTIAERLVISRRTVETYVERLLTKLGCTCRAEAAGIAARSGLLRPAPTPDGVADLARLTRGTSPYWP